MRTLIKVIILFCAAFSGEVLLKRPGWRTAISPPFLLLFVLFVAVRWRETKGALTGFIIGLICSGLFGEPPGVTSLIFSLVGYVSGKSAPFIVESPRFIFFLFALFMIVAGDAMASGVMALSYGSFFRLRIFSAVTGGFFFALVFTPMCGYFARQKR